MVVLVRTQGVWMLSRGIYAKTLAGCAETGWPLLYCVLHRRQEFVDPVPNRSRVLFLRLEPHDTHAKLTSSWWECEDPPRSSRPLETFQVHEALSSSTTWQSLVASEIGSSTGPLRNFIQECSPPRPQNVHIHIQGWCNLFL